MNAHAYLQRIGAPGEDLWQCQATECRDSGPLKKLLGRECKRTVKLDPAAEQLKALEVK